MITFTTMACYRNARNLIKSPSLSISKRNMTYFNSSFKGYGINMINNNNDISSSLSLLNKRYKHDNEDNEEPQESSKLRSHSMGDMNQHHRYIHDDEDNGVPQHLRRKPDKFELPVYQTLWDKIQEIKPIVNGIIDGNNVSDEIKKVANQVADKIIDDDDELFDDEEEKYPENVDKWKEDKDGIKRPDKEWQAEFDELVKDIAYNKPVKEIEKQVHKLNIGEVAKVIANPDASKKKHKQRSMYDLLSAIPSKKEEKEPTLSGKSEQLLDLSKTFDLYHIIEVDEFRESFIKFAEKEYAQENVKFIHDVTELQKAIEVCQNYEEQVKEKQKTIKERTKKINEEISRIYKHYIKGYRKNVVNTSGPVTLELAKGYDYNLWPDYPLSMKHAFFNDACLQCAYVLDKGAFYRYKTESEEFEKIKKKMESKKYQGEGKWGTVRRFEKDEAAIKLKKIRSKIVKFGNAKKHHPKLDQEIEKIIKD